MHMITLSYVPFGLSQYLYFHRIEMRDGANQIVGQKVTVIKHEEQDANLFKPEENSVLNPAELHIR